MEGSINVRCPFLLHSAWQSSPPLLTLPGPLGLGWDVEPGVGSGGRVPFPGGLRAGSLLPARGQPPVVPPPPALMHKFVHWAAGD